MAQVSEREEREVSVEPPIIPYGEEPDIIRDTIEEERRRVFSLARRIGISISGLMIFFGVLLLFISLQYLLYPSLNIHGLPDVRSLLTPELMIAAAGIIGLINLICGFVLLAQE